MDEDAEEDDFVSNVGDEDVFIANAHSWHRTVCPHGTAQCVLS